MTGSAASSGPGPAGPHNDCSESESEECWTKSWRMICQKQREDVTDHHQRLIFF